MNNKTKKYVVFVGGETAGPVMPLLAVAEAWKFEDENIQPVFVDIKRSVSAHIIPNHGYKFKSILAGKLRRYWTIKNIFSPLQTFIGLIQSLILLASLRPIVVVGAGGYIQVPVIIAAWMLHIPRVIHQQDIVPTFSNRICTPLANKITTTFEKSLKDFSQGLGFAKNYSKYTKVEWTGNPTIIKIIQPTQEQKVAAQKLFKLENDWPTVLVIGGGSGARGLNQAVAHNLPDLLKAAQVIHSTGPGKRVRPPEELPIASHDRYHQFEYINEIEQAYIAADIVIARAGIGTITALSVMSKVSIIVPMPDSHQEANAQYLYEKDAAIVLDERDIASDTLAKAVRKLLFDVEIQKAVQKNIRSIMPKDGTANMLAVIKTEVNAK